MQSLIRSVSRFLHTTLSNVSTGAFLKNQDLINATNQQNQIQLRLMYRQILASGQSLPLLSEVEFRGHSQNGEDGILLFIFALIGTINKMCAEICAGDGIQCNSANLIINHSWHGLLVDGDSKLVERGTRYYGSGPSTFFAPPIFKQAWITKDNINTILIDNGFTGEIDLLTIDVDGNDWWIWQAIDVINPRVVVVEINGALASDQPWIMPYQADFDKRKGKLHAYGYGASLSAFERLARAKGYRLIGIESHGINAFFIRDDVGQNIFSAVSANECLANSLFAKQFRAKHNDRLTKLTWIEADHAL